MHVTVTSVFLVLIVLNEHFCALKTFRVFRPLQLFVNGKNRDLNYLDHSVLQVLCFFSFFFFLNLKVNLKSKEHNPTDMSSSPLTGAFRYFTEFIHCCFSFTY